MDKIKVDVYRGAIWYTNYLKELTYELPEVDGEEMPFDEFRGYFNSTLLGSEYEVTCRGDSPFFPTTRYQYKLENYEESFVEVQVRRGVATVVLHIDTDDVDSVENLLILVGEMSKLFNVVNKEAVSAHSELWEMATW